MRVFSFLFRVLSLYPFRFLFLHDKGYKDTTAKKVQGGIPYPPYPVSLACIPFCIPYLKRKSRISRIVYLKRKDACILKEKMPYLKRKDAVSQKKRCRISKEKPYLKRKDAVSQKKRCRISKEKIPYPVSLVCIPFCIPYLLYVSLSVSRIPYLVSLVFKG